MRQVDIIAQEAINEYLRDINAARAEIPTVCAGTADLMLHYFLQAAAKHRAEVSK